MIQMQKNKARRDRADDTKQDQPTRDERAAEASADAACCLSDIDDVLADVDQALTEESEEDKARAELADLRSRFMADEIGSGEYLRQHRVWKAKYGHLNINTCVC